jgi:hypothetical protein
VLYELWTYSRTILRTPNLLSTIRSLVRQLGWLNKSAAPGAADIARRGKGVTPRPCPSSTNSKILRIPSFALPPPTYHYPRCHVHSVITYFRHSFRVSHRCARIPMRRIRHQLEFACFRPEWQGLECWHPGNLGKR